MTGQYIVRQLRRLRPLKHPTRTDCNVLHLIQLAGFRSAFLCMFAFREKPTAIKAAMLSWNASQPTVAEHLFYLAIYTADAHNSLVEISFQSARRVCANWFLCKLRRNFRLVTSGVEEQQQRRGEHVQELAANK